MANRSGLALGLDCPWTSSLRQPETGTMGYSPTFMM